jgi:hypothetical protein
MVRKVTFVVHLTDASRLAGVALISGDIGAGLEERE